MITKILSAAVIATASAAADAAPLQLWDFSFTGFDDPATWTFRPDVVLSGSFAGSDLNGDGILGLSELVSFRIDGHEYIGCGTPSDSWFMCKLGSFSFSPAAGLNFESSWHQLDQGLRDWAGVANTGGEYGLIYAPPPASAVAHPLQWSERTRFSITSAVPEPGRAAMLGAGLLAVAALRRKRSAHPN